MEHFDMDGNGKIDSYEFICAMTMLSHATLDEKAELIFQLYDFDGSKYISRDELVILMTNSLTSLKSMQKKPPPTIQEIEQKTDEFFRKSDVHGDKKITLKEFKDYIKQDKQVLEVLINANVAKKEDLGMDFGNGKNNVPDIDKDLENECNPKELSGKKANVKEGIDFVQKSGEDGLFESVEMGEGDQFMAVKPWLGVVQNSVPTNYKPNPRDSEAPDANLQLEHIYGYRCHDVRNNLRYTASGNLVYHAAAVGIVHNPQNNTQKFLIEHNDDIHSLAIDPSGKYCATGQIGPKPWLLIWDNESMQCVARIQGNLLKGVMQLAFSNDGKYLAASAMDDDHSIAIYDWQAPLKPGQAIKPLAFGKGTRANILSLGFSPDAQKVVATCVKEVNFFTYAGGIIKGTKGVGWGTQGAESVLSQAYIDNTLYTGTFNGSIITWADRSISGKPIKAHASCVNTMIARKTKKGLISGGNDGIIIVWQFAGQLQEEKRFDLNAQEVRSLIPKVRSVCEHQSNGMVLVGTRGGEIIEFGQPKPIVHMRSHCDGELWGLAPHPQKSEFVTIGQDNMLAIWDIPSKRQKKFARLDCAGNVLAFTSDGGKLAIGFTNGQVTVLDQNFQVIVIRKDRTKAIQEIKFSPDNSICAVGAHDSMIFTYNANQNFKPMKKLRGHHSTITHFDFSLDGRVLMSNCTSYEILYFDLNSGKQLTGGASQNKNETWSTWTCTLGWPVQGIFPPCADGSDINSCDRAPDHTVLATGDDFGMVKLFKYPSPVEKASFNQYIGHSSHVTNVRFMPKTNYLVSTGGEDKTIFQWKYILDKESQAQSDKTKNTKIDTSSLNQDVEDPFGGGMFEEEKVGEGDQRLAVLPFKGEIYAPTGFKQTPDGSNHPDGNLKLKYAHGFRSFDTRGNLKYTSTGEVAFTTAALGIVLNKETNTQRFFNLHQDDVVALALHPQRDIIATGQMAAKGKAKVIDIFVWSASTQECLARINGFHRRAVRNLAFSPNGDKLLSIGEDDFHSVAIYDWANNRMISNSKVDPDKVFDAQWKDETEFMTVGMKHVKFFTAQGQNLVGNKGLYGAVGPTPMICCSYVFNEKIPLTGTPKGDLIVWSGRTVGKVQKGHTDALWAILSVMNNTMIITGANDGKILMWDKTFTQKRSIDLTALNKLNAGIRSLDFNEQTKNLLVGTRGAEIIEVDTNKGTVIKTLINGHFEGTKQAELWGCACHPTEQIFASCGADSMIRVWSENKMLKASQPFQNDLTALDWSSNGLFLAAGDRNGIVYTVHADTLQQMAQAPGKNANQKNAWVQDVKIAPNSQILAFGTHGGRSNVELVKVLDNGRKLQKIQSVDVKISSSLTHLDWTIDSNCVVINSQAYELMWLDVNSKQRIYGSGAKDFEYASWTCILGFPVQGIWPGPDFTDVNCTCRSNSRQVLATADDFGTVKLFKYPCNVENASFKSYMGHSSHVTRVKFSKGDRFIVSTGGNDKTVIVWETDFCLDNPGQGQQQQYEDVQYDANDDGFDVDMKDHSKEQKLQMKEDLQRSQKKLSKPIQQEDDFFQVEDVGEGDEFMAVKPWIGQMKEPSGFQKPPINQEKAPAISMNLEWVHGYRSRDAKNNLQYLVDGSVAYHAAGLGICLDVGEYQQRFFDLHTDDVTAIAFSSDLRTIATGELGRRPVIYIYDGITMGMKFKLQGKLQNGIQGLAFSPSGKILAAVAMDDNHSVAVYNAETGAFMAMTQGDKAQILELTFKNETEFCSAGVKHFMSWRIAASLSSTRGNFAKYDQRIGSCRFNGNDCLTGSITGELYIWGGTAVTKTLKLHAQPLDAIYVNDQYVLTGGRDQKVNILSKTYQQVYSFQVDEAAFKTVSGRVRALCLNQQNNKLLVGTYGSEIYEININLQTKNMSAPQVLIQGHYSPLRKDNNEVWGLAAFPKKDLYVTCSDDATLRIWNSLTRKQEKMVKLDIDANGQVLPLDPATQEHSHACQGRCLDISPDEKFCAVGFRDGGFRIYSTTDNWKYIAKKNPSKKQIGDIKFSPDGSLLGVASHDCKIYIFSFPKLDQKAILKSSTAFVTHFDWSIDSQKIHSNDASYEILYYNAQTGKQDTGGASSMRDEPWSTWTLILGWPVQGIWPPGVDGTDINGVDRSKKPHPDGYHLVASADDFSKVKVFRYPSIRENSEFIEGRGHSSHVTQVKWSKDDQTLFSSGGNDTCIFQWKIEK